MSDEPNPPATWQAVLPELLRLVVMTACVIGVMMVSAQHPSLDDAVRPGIGIAVGALLGAFSKRFTGW